jgi:hypothetical protein
MDYIGDYFKHEDHKNYTYSSTWSENFPGTNLKSIHIKDYTITHPTKDEIFISGKTFLAPAACNYYHSMVDVIGTYEFLKSKYSDISMRFGIKDEFPEAEPGMFSKHMQDINNNYTKEIHRLYNPENVTFNFQDCHVRFEEVILMPTRSMWHQDRMTPLKLQDNLFTLSHEDLLPIRIEYIKKIKEKFEPLIKTMGNKKSYCIRGNSFSKDLDRSYDESQLIEFFKSKGYNILNMETIPLLDQFSLMRNTEYSAGIDGSNMFNCIFMRPESTIYLISTQRWWSYEFIKYFKELKINVIHIGAELIKNLPLENGIHISSSQIIEELKVYSI